MAARRQRSERDDRERLAAEAKRQQFFDEEVGKPLKYVMHDVNAHDDPKLQDLRDDHGFEALGRWWLLVELLGGRVGHCYDVSRPNGWKRLSHDLEFGRTEEGVAKCVAFVKVLVDLRLLNEESFTEMSQVRSRRIDRNAGMFATDVANKRYAVYCREKNRSSDA